MITNTLSPILRYRQLTYSMTKRDILGRYRGASFGLFWSLISPFLMLIVYTIAFGYILRSRWPGHEGGTTEFALILYLGLIVHGLIAECLVRAPSIIISNTNLVKRVVFPLEILPWSAVFSAVFHMAASALIFVALSMLIRGHVPVLTLLLPVVFFPLIVLTIALSLLLAAFGVYVRDVHQVSGVLSTALLFLSSAIVPVETLPESYRWIFYLNPLTFIIDQARNVAFFGRMPDVLGLLVYFAAACVSLYVASVLFAKAKRGFADVL